MDVYILVVEDDVITRLSIAAILEGAGYHVTEAADGEKAISLIEQADGAGMPYNVVITDLRMGTIDGIEVLYAARTQQHPAEVIILTGYGTMDTSIAALRAGAYDYLIKPCEPTDLLAYVAGAVQRHISERRQADVIRAIAQIAGQWQNDPLPMGPEDPPLSPRVYSQSEPDDRFIRVGALCIDNFRHIVSFNGEEIHLTPIEYAVLRCLAQEHGRVLHYCEIARRTHGHVSDKSEAHALLKPHIHKLRRKIDPDYFINVRSTGYMLAVPEA